MRIKPELGIMGNIKALFNEGNKTNNKIQNNKAETDAAILEAEADLVEAVMDEYYAIIGEEPEGREAENV